MRVIIEYRSPTVSSSSFALQKDTGCQPSVIRRQDTAILERHLTACRCERCGRAPGRRGGRSESANSHPEETSDRDIGAVDETDAVKR